MQRWAARLAAIFFLAFSVFQLSLGLGAPFGAFAWGGSTEVLPATLRWSSAAACVVLMLASGVMLVRAGDVGRTLPTAPFWWVNALLAVQLALNTLANLASRSPAERMVMTPATTVGLFLCIAALLLPREKRIRESAPTSAG